MFPGAPSLNEYLFFILIIFPGLVSMHFYRLLMPARDIDWKTALIEALFWGTVNFAFCLPIILPIHREEFISEHFVWYVLLLMFVLLLVPICLPILLLFAIKFSRKLQLPYPTAWDFFFCKRQTCYIIVHLKSGELIAGYYGGKSYATSFPRHGDIYLEQVIAVDSAGKFLKIIEDSAGTLVPREAYDYLEMLRDPKRPEEKSKVAE